MKKILLFMLGGLMSLPALGFTYEYQGQTLNYTVIDETAKTCKVGQNVKTITGAVVIPATAKDGETEYSVTSIGNKAFSGCSGLTGVTIPGSVTSIGNDAFYNCGSLTGLTIPGSVTSIGEYAFANCTKLESMEIPNKVESIAWAAFSGCEALTSVTIPSSVKSIESSAFSRCSNLAEVDIPNSVTSIGNDAFGDCTSLTEITIPESVESIGMRAFARSGLTSVTIPSTVTSVGTFAFSSCQSLSSATIENSEVPTYAFYECLNLEKVTLGENVASIGASAFALSSEENIESQIIEINSLCTAPPTLDASAFINLVKQNAIVKVPSNSIDSYKNAPVWSEFKHYEDVTTGIDNVTIGLDEGVEVYTLEGVRIFKGTESDVNLSAGIYIVRQGNSVKKIAVK